MHGDRYFCVLFVIARYSLCLYNVEKHFNYLAYQTVWDILYFSRVYIEKERAHIICCEIEYKQFEIKNDKVDFGGAAICLCKCSSSKMIYCFCNIFKVLSVLLT